METIFLEQWLHNLIKQKVKEDPEYRRFVGKDHIGQVTRADIERYHLFKLRKTLDYAYERSAFYRELFDQNGIKVSDIKSLSDLAKIPFTQPADLAQHRYRFACVPLGDMVRRTTFTSSGTTGPRKRIFFTQRDLETITDFMSVGIRAVATKGDVVQIMLPSFRPNDQAHLLARGVEKMGGVPVVTGTTPSSEEQLRVIDENHPTVLFAGVSRMYRITQETRYMHDLSRKGVKAVFVTSEYLADSMRKQLQDAWNCDVHTHYGLTEMGLGVAVECHVHNGYHFNEADLLLEVVDPDTGAVLPDGKEGELVFTTLSMEGTPLLRYRTHDISAFFDHPCECGAATLKKVARVARRLEAVVKTSGGGELHPAMFDEIIFGIPDVVDYQLTLGKEGNRDTLLFKVEVIRQNEDIRNMVASAVSSYPLIRENMAAKLMAPPEVQLVAQGTLVRLTRAKKLILDERCGKC